MSEKMRENQPEAEMNKEVADNLYFYRYGEAVHTKKTAEERDQAVHRAIDNRISAAPLTREEVEAEFGKDFKLWHGQVGTPKQVEETIKIWAAPGITQEQAEEYYNPKEQKE